jgi:hypothetical protein
VAQEMTGDTADDCTFNAAARPSLGWYGENDGRKTATNGFFMKSSVFGAV